VQKGSEGDLDLDSRLNAQRRKHPAATGGSNVAHPKG